MHPTLEEELAGVRRILRDVASDPTVTADVAAAVNDASTILGRIERSYRRVLPHVLSDIAELTDLLVNISQHLPLDMRQAVQALASERSYLVAAAGDMSRVNDLRQTARALVSRAIELLPPDPPGQEGPLARIRKSLTSSLETRPW